MMFSVIGEVGRDRLAARTDGRLRERIVAAAAEADSRARNWRRLISRGCHNERLDSDGDDIFAGVFAFYLAVLPQLYTSIITDLAGGRGADGVDIA